MIRALTAFRSWFLVLLLAGCGAAPASAVPPARAPAQDDAPGDPPEAATERSSELPAAEVVQHLRGNENDLRRCFFENPSLRGAATFTWRLDVNGKVHRVRHEASTWNDPSVERCIAERLREIRFGYLERPARARWTFVFRLVDRAPERNARRSAQRKKPHAAPDDQRGVSIDPRSSGELPVDAIDNVVEAGYPLFARCYRDGVSRNNALGGTVRLRFVVGKVGSVSEVSDDGSDLSDRQVVDCIAEGFYALRFPKPEHGSVNVRYRIGFEAG